LRKVGGVHIKDAKTKEVMGGAISRSREQVGPSDLYTGKGNILGQEISGGNTKKF